MVQRIYNYAGTPGVNPTPAPAVPAPVETPPVTAPGPAINAWNWGDKMFGGGIKSMTDAQRIFDQIWQMDPRLAYNFLEETNAWTPQFAQGGLGRDMRRWVQQKYFNMSGGGGDTHTLTPESQRYNTWINMSSPVGSNAHSITPQEKYWMYKMINQGNSAWGTELSNWFKNAPGAYYSGVSEDWNPYKLTLQDLYGGIYQDGRGGAYNPAQLSTNPPPGTLAGQLPNPYLGGTNVPTPTSPTAPAPAPATAVPRGTPGTYTSPTQRGAPRPTPSPAVPPPPRAPEPPSTPVSPYPNSPVNPHGTRGYQYNPSRR